MLPATGFLGLGPWYYDNGSNEVTRADGRVLVARVVMQFSARVLDGR